MFKETPQLPVSEQEIQIQEPPFLDKLRIHKFKIWGGMFIVLLLAGTVFAGYQLGQKRFQPEAGELIPSATPLPTPTPDLTADWQTYTNTEYGYSIKYPENWYMTEPEGGPEEGKRANFHPWRERSLDKVGYQISIIVSGASSEEDLGSWLDEKFAAYPEEVRKLITREKIVLENFEGEKVLEEAAQAGVYNIYTKKDNFVYNFMLAPYSPENLPYLLPESLDYFNLILSTFRFLDSSGSGSEGEICVKAETGEEMNLAEAREIALASECGQEGTLKETYSCNQYTGTWWLDLDIQKEGCAPACVVDVATKEAEINWRCAGLIPPCSSCQD